MKKHFLIPQPPATKKYTFLVDDINHLKNWGLATDLDKIEYNRRLLGEDFNIDLKVKLLFTDKGSTTVLPIGRFITVIQTRADENAGRMMFLDFDVRLTREEIRDNLTKTFSVNIADKWLEFYDLMRLEFTHDDDNVLLLKPDEPDLS